MSGGVDLFSIEVKRSPSPDFGVPLETEECQVQERVTGVR